MKLRVAHYSSHTRMAGEYIIERRRWLLWWVMATEIADGCFETKQEAMYVVRRHLNPPKITLLQTYDVRSGRERP